MSVIRVLQIRCDTCGRTVDGGDPRHGVGALRRRVRGEGWFSAQGAKGGQGVDVCDECLSRGAARIDEAADA